MEVPLLHSHRHDQTSQKQHVGILQVVPGGGICGEDPQRREEHEREESSGSNRDSLTHPVHSNDEDGIERPGSLQRHTVGVPYEIVG